MIVTTLNINLAQSESKRGSKCDCNIKLMFVIMRDSSLQIWHDFSPTQKDFLN